MKNKYIKSAIFILFIHGELFSQGWEKVYQGVWSKDNSSHGPSTQKMQPTSDNGIILVGEGSIDFSTVIIFLIKTDSSGNIIWSKYFSVMGNLSADAIIETNDGFFIGGSIQINNINSSVLLKTDLNGNLIWAKKYPGTIGIEMIIEADNNIIILNNKTGGSGFQVSKINPLDGNNIWSKNINENINPKGMALATDSAFVIIANNGAVWGNGRDCFLLKFDFNGNLLWSKSYGYVNDFVVNTVRLTMAGNFIIAGSVLMNVDQNGNMIWIKHHTEPPPLRIFTRHPMKDLLQQWEISGQAIKVFFYGNLIPGESFSGNLF